MQPNIGCDKRKDTTFLMRLIARSLFTSAMGHIGYRMSRNQSKMGQTVCYTFWRRAMLLTLPGDFSLSRLSAFRRHGMIRTFSIAATAVLILSGMQTASAAPPDLKTPAPVIFLADNLDENQNLGFCIDTVGRGLSDRLHAHSCKPQGEMYSSFSWRPPGRSSPPHSRTFVPNCSPRRRMA